MSTKRERQEREQAEADFLAESARALWDYRTQPAPEQPEEGDQ